MPKATAREHQGEAFCFEVFNHGILYIKVPFRFTFVSASKSYNACMEISPLHTYLLAQLKRAEGLLQQIHSDRDYENLHQYRVCMRRIRSLLLVYFKESDRPEDILKPLLKSTNILRETDVFVMGVDAMQYPLLTKELKKYRKEIYLQHWSEDTLQVHLKALNRLLEDLPTRQQKVPDAFLSNIALEQYEEVLVLTKGLSDISSAKKIHKVRIRCKQARYVLEFIEESGLRSVGKEIKKCKNIQKHFGDIQDAANQLKFLKHFCKIYGSDECHSLYKERKAALKSLKSRL